jgi:hypothetical protein
MRKSSGAHQGLGFGPPHEERYADACEYSQDMGRPFVTDAKTVFESRTIKPLVQAAFHPPILPVGIEKGFRWQDPGRAAGYQIFDFWGGSLA